MKVRRSTDRRKIASRAAWLALLVACLGAATASRAQSIDFSPVNLAMPVGESRLVAVTVSGLDPESLSAYQISLTFDPSVIRVVNPNEAFRGTVPPFAPLGGNALCETVRGEAPCPDPVWQLTETGRTAMQGPELIDNVVGSVQIVYGTRGADAPATGGGAIALLEIVAQQEGDATITISNSVLANSDDPPAPIGHGAVTLPVTVTGGAGNLPPVLAAIGARSVAEGAILDVPISATDPDGDPLTLSATGLPAFAGLVDNGDGTGTITATPGFLDAGVYPITVTAFDSQLTTDEVFSLTVINTNRPPAVTNPGDQTNREGDPVSLAIVANDPDGDVLTLGATGLPPGVDIDAASGLISGTLSFDSEGTYAVQVTANDGNDTAIVGFTWIVTATNRTPTLNLPSDQIDDEGDVVALTLTGSDADGDTLTFGATGLPPGLGIDAASGLISGTLGFDAAGVYVVNATVSDGTDTDAASFNWTVNDVNRSPVLTNPGDQLDDEGDAVNLLLAATDADGDTLTFGASGLPPGLGIDPATGAITGTLDFEAAGIYPVIVNVTDGTDTDNASFNWTVNETNRAPVITTPADQINDEGDAVNLPIVATDDDGDTLTWGATGLPPGLAIDPASGTITGTLPFDSAGNYTVEVSAADGTDTGTAQFNWTVGDVNQTPALTSPGAQVNDEGDVISLGIVANDADGDVLTFGATGLPPGLAIDTASGVIAGTLGFDAAGAYIVNVNVTDGTDTDDVTFDWTVNDVNRAPTLTSPGDQFNDEGDVVGLGLAATDPDGDTLTYGATGLPTGLAIDSATGTVSGTLGFDAAGTYPVTFTVGDGTDTATANITWTVNDQNQAPVLTPPADQTSDEGDTINLVVVASDADGDTLTFGATGLPPGLGIDPANGAVIGTLGFDAAGVYIVQVSVSDGTVADNASFNWTVNDVNRAPTLASPGDQQDDEGDTVNLVLAGADADGDTLTFSATGLPPGLGIDPASGAITGTLDFDSAGVYPVNASVTDGAETANVGFTWTVTAVNQAPTLASPGDQTNDEGDTVNLALVGADADGDTLTYGAAGLPPGLAIDPASGVIAGNLGFDAAGGYAATATVTDGTDTATVNFAWTVANQNRAPVLASPGAQQSDEGEVVSLAVSANDPDGDTLTYAATGLPPGLGIDSVSGVISGTLDFASAGTYDVMLTVSDGDLDDSAAFVWTVGGVNQAPTLDNPGTQTNDEGDNVDLQLVGADGDGEPLTYAAAGLPPGIGIDTANGRITGSLGFDAAGNYPVQASATDGVDTATVAFDWIVADVNRAPDLTTPAAQVNDEGDVVNLPVAASDPDGDTLTFGATGLPPGLGIDAVGGAITGTVDFDAAGAYVVNLSVSDGGDTTNGSFNWTVNDVNRAPSLTSPGDQTSDEGEIVNLLLAGNDPDGDTLNYGATGLPPGLAIDPASGAITGTLGFDAAGVYAVQATVSDGTETVNVGFGWTVNEVNRAPDVTNPGSQLNDEGDTVDLTIVASDPDGDTLTYAAVDLPPGLAIDPASGAIAGAIGFDAAGAYNTRVTVADGTDTTETQFAWTVTEVNRAPELTVPAEQFAEEGDTINLSATATDADGDTLTFGATGLPAGLAIAATTGDIAGVLGFDTVGTYTVQVSVDDGTDTATASFVINVADVNRAPTLTAPADQSSDEGDTIGVALIASDPDGDALTYGATGLPPGLAIDPVSGLISGTLGFDSAGGYAVQVNVTDGADTAVANFNWTVADVNRPPEIVPPGPQQDDEGEAVSLQIVATDEDGDTLTYGAVGLPPGLGIDAVSGLISGTLSFAAAGSYNVSVNVGDGSVSVASNFTWTVGGVNRSPELTSPGDQFSAEGDVVNLPVVANDPDGDTLTFSATGLPPGLAIDPAGGVIGGALDFDAAGTYTTLINVTDGVDTAGTTINWTVNDVNRAPTVTSPGPQSNAEGDIVNLPIVAADEDGDTLTFSATGLPPGLGIDAVTGLIAGEIDTGAAGSYTAAVTASDAAESTTVGFDWLVVAGNAAPVLTVPGPQTNAEGDTVSLQVIASDADADPLTYAATGLPTGLAIAPSTGLITGLLDFDAAGTYAVTVNVSDGVLSDSGGFSWLVNNTNRAPAVTPPAAQTNDEGDIVSLAVTGTDEDGDTLTYGAVGLPPGIAIDPATGNISGTLGFDAAGTYAITVSVNDGTDSTTAGFAWTVADVNRSPSLTPVTDQTGQVGDTVLLQVIASDPDGDPLTFSAVGLPPDLVIDPASGAVGGTLADAPGAYAVTVTVTDGADDATTAFEWLVESAANTPPDVTNPGNQTNEEGDDVDLQIVASDADGDTLSFTADGLPPGLAIDAQTGAITGTIEAASVGSYAATVSVSDGTDTVTVSFDWTVQEPAPIVTLTIPIKRNPDDAEESLDDQSVIRNTALDLVTRSDGVGQLVGLRFRNVQIPRGATVANAWIQLTAREPGSESTDLELRGEASGDAAVFKATGANLSSREQTVASVDWTVAEWLSAGDAGPEQQSPDLAPILQEITLRPDWQAGNSVAILIGGSGRRVAESKNSKSVAAAVLTVEFNPPPPNQPPVVDNPGDQLSRTGDVVSLPIMATDPDGNALTYTAKGLPPGLTIDPATGVIAGTVASDSVGNYSVRIGVDDGIEITDVPFDWAVWPEPGFVGTVEVAIAAARDDAEEDVVTGEVVRFGPLDIGARGNGALQLVGLRFTNVILPSDAIVRGAWVQFTTKKATDDAAMVTVRGEATPEPGFFRRVHGDLSGRPMTAATVDWTVVPWIAVGDAGDAQRTPDLSPIIQELLLLPRSVIEQDIVLLIEGSGRRVANSFNTASALAPRLVIEYELP